MPPESVQNISETLTHNDLEKEDIRLEGDIKLLNSLLTSFDKRLEDIDKQVKFTNGKVRAHQIWISCIGGGAIVLMFALSFFRDSLVGIIADAVVKRITETYDPIIK